MRILGLLILCLALSSCTKKKVPQVEDTNKNKKVMDFSSQENCMYDIDRESVKLTWTGYKFTSKEPVSGTFEDIMWTIQPGKNANALMANLKFQIKTKSIDSGMRIRDKRLYKYLFQKMKNPEFIEGYGISFDETKNQALIELNMNETRTPAVFTTKIFDDWTFELVGVIDMLKHYKMNEAVESISKKCEKLHTGEDGVAKTWTEVGLKLTGKMLKNCN